MTGVIERSMRSAERLLILLLVSSCGGIAITDGPGGAAGGAGPSSAGRPAVEAGSAGEFSGTAGASFSGAAGQANRAGAAGSSSPTTAHCAGPLQIADPDLEAILRKQIDKPTQPLYASDFANVTALRFIPSGPGPCPTAPDCPSLDPLASDGWVSSLIGLECLPHLQQVEADAWYVKDFSPLSASRGLTVLRIFFSKGAYFPPLPQLRELQVSNSDGDLSELAGMFNLTSFTGMFKDLSAKNALAPLRALTALQDLVLTRSQITDVSGLEALGKLVTVDLSDNNISDLSPLLQNMAFGANTTLNVSGNPITCDDASVAALIARKVKVEPCGQ